jgi:hypothetical protein
MIRWCIEVGNYIFRIFLYIFKLKQVLKIGFRVTKLEPQFFHCHKFVKKNELDEALSALPKK